MTDQPPWTHDRRRALRVEVPRQATLDVTRTDCDAPVALRQISTRGMVVEGQTALPPDSACDVRLAVQGFRPLTLEGHVVYSRAAMTLDADARVRFASAVAFDRLTLDDAGELAAIVAFLGATVETGDTA